MSELTGKMGHRRTVERRIKEARLVVRNSVQMPNTARSGRLFGGMLGKIASLEGRRHWLDFR
jgi:hypothetical protein